MPRDVLSLDQLRSVTGTAFGDTAANHKRRQAALHVLRLALQQELTPRQRQCMELCVLQGLSQVEAGRQLGVNKATVCRHLKRPSGPCAGRRAMPGCRCEGHCGWGDSLVY